jgi:hypothetical protein
MSVNYPDDPTPEEKVKIRSFLEIFAKTLTCRYCKDHFTRMLDTYAITHPEYLDSKRDLFIFIARAHNTTNRRLDKPVFSTVAECLQRLRENTVHVSGKEFREKYINYLIRNWAYDMSGDGMIMKVAAYELKRINVDYLNNHEQTFDISIEEGDVLESIAESSYIRTPAGIPVNLLNISPVGFKGGKLKLARR